MSEPITQELTQQLAVLEERMNTKQAESESAIDRLRADMANWKTDMAKRENRLMLVVFGAVGLGTAILGVLIAMD